jgi:hypothetical protein
MMKCDSNRFHNKVELEIPENNDKNVKNRGNRKELEVKTRLEKRIDQEGETALRTREHQQQNILSMMIMMMMSRDQEMRRRRH